MVSIVENFGFFSDQGPGCRDLKTAEHRIEAWAIRDKGSGLSRNKDSDSAIGLV